MTIASLRPAPARWFVALIVASLLLVTGAPAGAAPGTPTPTPDPDQVVQETLAALDTAGSYRFLRYDVLSNNHQPNLFGEVNVSQGGRFVALDDGAISATDPNDPATLDDAVLRFATSGGDGWVLDRTETANDGSLRYVFVESPAAEVGGRKVRVSFLVIDAATHLPLRSRQYGTDHAGPYAYESTYFDFGDAVNPSPAVATPVPGTDMGAAGCGNQNSSPIEVAEVFLAGAIAVDPVRVAACFSPDRQPRGWEDVFLGASRGRVDDLTGCLGVPYVVRESALRPDFSAVVFSFDSACAVAALDSWQRDLYDSETLPVTTVVVQLHREDGRWYVQDAFASAPD